MPDSPFFQNVDLHSARLRVFSLERMLSFYRDVLGFRVISNDGTRAELSATGEAPALLILEEHPGAPLRARGTEGLFHLAFLYPDRNALGTALRHLIDANHPLAGASDHGVSEAIYLADPEDNGLELYADRPPESWPRSAEYVEMTTAPLALAPLLAGADSVTTDYAIPVETRLGHVHLNVLDVNRAESVVCATLAMPVRQRNYPGVLFFGYDDYHHHLATNRWGIERPAERGVLGLSDFAVTVRGPIAAAVEASQLELGGVTIFVTGQAQRKPTPPVAAVA